MNKRNIQHGYYGWYEKGAMEKIETLEFRFQASRKLIYVGICSMSAKQKNSTEVNCFKFHLARFASVSEKTVQRALPQLEELGIIKMSPQDRKSNGRFEKVRIWLIDNTSTDGLGGDTAGTREGLPSPIYINKEIKKEKDIDQKFSIFWNAYPRKIGKGNALKAWKKLTTTEKDKAIGVIPQHIASKQWQDSQFIPHPSTWLNRSGWDDEVEKCRPEEDVGKLDYFAFRKKHGEELAKKFASQL